MISLHMRLEIGDKGGASVPECMARIAPFRLAFLKYFHYNYLSSFLSCLLLIRIEFALLIEFRVFVVHVS